MLSPVISGHAVDWGRAGYSPHRVLIEQLQGFLNGSFELRISPFDYVGRSVFDLDVRGDAFVFYCPLAGQVIECKARRCDSAAVDGSWNTKRAYQAAPGAGADERSELSQSEIVRQG